MKILLTDLAIQKLKWNGKTTVYWHEKLPAFGVRVGKQKRTFVVIQGNERRVTTIGHYPSVSLQEATKRARIALARGLTPETGYKGLCEAFERDMTPKLKPDTMKQYMSYLNQMGFDKPVAEITYKDITEKLQPWSGKPFAQNYAYASIRNFINWCLEHEYITKSPLFRKLPPNKTRSRDRVLSDEELGRIWRCTEDDTYSRILRLLILTGQRRMEVRNLKPENIQDGYITFHTKGDKTNILPVTPLVEEELQHLPFTFNNWGVAKQRFDTDCGVSFRNHDLRRTLATRLVSLGVSVVTVERILGHAVTGIVGVYQRYDYMKEKRDALLLWEQHIRKIVTPGH